MTIKQRINIILVIILAGALGILSVAIKADKQMKFNQSGMQNKLIDRYTYNEIKQIESAETEHLIALLDEAEAKHQKEQEFKQAYLNASTKVSQKDINILGNIIYNESRGESKLVWSCIAWTVMNHCDRDNESVEYEANFPNRFCYKPEMNLKSEKANKLYDECKAIAKDVMIRHILEQEGLEEVGRTLPNNYYSYWGDGKETHFRKQIKMYDYWDFSLGNPYEEEL